MSGRKTKIYLQKWLFLIIINYFIFFSNLTRHLDLPKFAIFRFFLRLCYTFDGFIEFLTNFLWLLLKKFIIIL